MASGGSVRNAVIVINPVETTRYRWQMTDLAPMPPAWQPRRDRRGLLWGAVVLLGLSVCAGWVSWPLYSFAAWAAATDPVEGMIVMFPATGGLLATGIATGSAIAATAMVQKDGVPRVSRWVVAPAGNVCAGASLALPLIVLIGSQH